MPKTPTYFFPIQFNLRVSSLSTYHQAAGKRSLNPPIAVITSPVQSAVNH